MVVAQIKSKFPLQLLVAVSLIFIIFPSTGLSVSPPDLTELDIEELMNLEITSVAKKPQKLSEAAAAVFVITQEDIRRSGATSIPEVLRMVPGLQVARIDANKWAITARGFNGFLANKLLVLMDGRSVYTPLYSGVFWHIQDTFLEDIDRIEVIRGPGATLWGANAINGVINIITKNAKETRKWVTNAGIGTEERGFAGIRYGGKSQDETYYRIYGKYLKRDDSVYLSGGDAVDGWDDARCGFRIDSRLLENDSFTLQGDFYDGEAGSSFTVASPSPPFFPQTVNEDVDVQGGNILGRWKHCLSDSSDVEVQVYYDRTKYFTEEIDEIRDTVDLDIQHQFTLGKNHEILWGVGYRYTRDKLDSRYSVTFDPDSRHDDLFSAFVQDDILLIKNRVRLILGSKLEYNDYTGFEFQPNVRVMWTPGGIYSAWVAVSRAVRTPSRGEHDAQFMLPLGVSLFGSDGFDSEELIAYELGFRMQPTDRLSIDVAGFYNDYDNLRTVDAGPVPTILVIGNKMEGGTYGVELAGDWRVLNWWRLTGAYTYLQMQLHPDQGSTVTIMEAAEGESPHHQISVRSTMNLKENIELDLWGRYVDNLPAQDIGSYITIDIRIGWHPRDNLELSVAGQNLLDGQHPEYRTEFDINVASPTEVERSVYGKITWRF